MCQTGKGKERQKLGYNLGGPLSAYICPSITQDTIYRREVLTILHEEKAGNRRWFSVILSEHSQISCSEATFWVSYFGFSDAVKCIVYYQAKEKEAILKLILCEKKKKEKAKKPAFHTV